MNDPEITCPHCQSQVPAQLDFCIFCGSPVTSQGHKIKRDDARGCAFFVFLLLAMLFFLAGLSALFLSTRSSEFADPNLRKLFLPGTFFLSLSIVCTGVLFYIAGLNRKTRRQEGQLPDSGTLEAGPLEK